MKVQILDTDALLAVSPAALATFARIEGWNRTDTYGEHADVYAGHDLPEIVLPRNDQLADYASVVSRLIDEFARVAERDALSTYRSLVAADRDVVRVRAIGNEGEGSVALDAGVEIVSRSRDMLLAAACAVRAPQPLYRAGANKEASNYMQRVKLGQTEHGSFVVTLLAPVPPLLSDVNHSPGQAWTKFEDEPMERMVTRRLMEALKAARTAAEMAISGEPDTFDNAISSGVSANLCEAVAGLIKHSDGLDISVTWAQTRPTPETSRRVIFSQNDAEILHEAARNFRLRQPMPDVTLYGTVHKLKREQEEIEGVVTLKAIVEDKMQSVRAVLDQENYRTATQAHEAKEQLIVTGDLERVGQRWQLTNAMVRLLPDESFDEDQDAEAAAI